MAIVYVNDGNFSQETKYVLVIVEWLERWCGHYKMIATVIEELAEEQDDDVKIAKLNVDDNQETAGKYGGISILILLLMKDSNVVDQVAGFQPKEALT